MIINLPEKKVKKVHALHVPQNALMQIVLIFSLASAIRKTTLDQFADVNKAF